MKTKMKIERYETTDGEVAVEYRDGLYFVQHRGYPKEIAGDRISAQIDSGLSEDDFESLMMSDDLNAE